MVVMVLSATRTAETFAANVRWGKQSAGDP